MTTDFWTIGAIARAAGVALHRVEYFINSRAIRPVGRAGALRVFDEDAARRIISELRPPEKTKGAAR